MYWLKIQYMGIWHLPSMWGVLCAEQSLSLLLELPTAFTRMTLHIELLPEVLFRAVALQRLLSISFASVNDRSLM